MISMLFASRWGRALVLIAAAITSFLFAALILRHGIRSWSDSWSDWEGSVSLIEHGTYTKLRGDPILEWPPLYSVYLALFQLLFGQTGWTLILSMCVLVALNVGVWGSYIFKVIPTEEKPIPLAALLGSLVFLVIFLPINFTSLLPNGLLLIFVGLILGLLAAITEDKTPWGGVRKSIPTGVLLALCVFNHNSAIIYITASVIIILFKMPTHLRQRLIAVGLILLISGCAWISIPHGIDSKVRHVALQTGAAPSTSARGSHFLFDPKCSVQEYLVQWPEGIGTFFISSSSIAVQAMLGVTILATAIYFLLLKPQTALESRQQIFIAFALLASFGHFLIFNIVYLEGQIVDRWVWYFAVIMVPIFFYRFRRNWPLIVLLLVLTVGVSGWRLVKLARNGKVPPLVTSSSEVTNLEIHPQYFVTSKPHPIVPAGAIQIVTPEFVPIGQPNLKVHGTVTLIHPGSNQP